VRGGVGGHLLEPGAGATLTTSPLGLGGAGTVETLDQIVADRLELGHVRHVALGSKERMGGLPGLAGVGRVGGELRREVRDLATQLPAAEPLVALGREHLGPGLARQHIGARGVDRAREIARIDAALAGALDGLGCQALQIR
jgi:hypothetical protein